MGNLIDLSRRRPPSCHAVVKEGGALRLCVSRGFCLHLNLHLMLGVRVWRGMLVFGVMDSEVHYIIEVMAIGSILAFLSFIIFVNDGLRGRQTSPEGTAGHQWSLHPAETPLSQRERPAGDQHRSQV